MLCFFSFALYNMPAMERIMTEKTREILASEKKRLEERVIAIGQDSEGGHDRAAWHDSAGVQHEKNNLLASLAKIGELGRVSIINPRQETDAIGVGNQVKVRFSDSKEDEIIFLLGPDDAIRRQDLTGKIVSAESPLGKALLGKAANETVELKVPNLPSAFVRVMEISPGAF